MRLDRPSRHGHALEERDCERGPVFGKTVDGKHRDRWAPD